MPSFFNLLNKKTYQFTSTIIWTISIKKLQGNACNRIHLKVISYNIIKGLFSCCVEVNRVVAFVIIMLP